MRLENLVKYDLDNKQDTHKGFNIFDRIVESCNNIKRKTTTKAKKILRHFEKYDRLTSVYDSVAYLDRTNSSEKVNRIINTFSDAQYFSLDDRLTKVKKIIKQEKNLTTTELETIIQVNSKLCAEYTKRICKLSEYEYEEIKGDSKKLQEVVERNLTTDYQKKVFSEYSSLNDCLLDRILDKKNIIEERLKIPYKGLSMGSLARAAACTAMGVLLTVVFPRVLSDTNPAGNSNKDSNNLYLPKKIATPKTIINNSLTYNIIIKPSKEKKSSDSIHSKEHSIMRNTPYSTKIMGEADMAPETWITLFKKKNPLYEYTKKLVDSTYIICKMYGVNPSVQLAQTGLESYWLQYGGSVKSDQYNFGGLGATSDTTRGNTFTSISEGIEAQTQHLLAYGAEKAYATIVYGTKIDTLELKTGLKRRIVDKRFKLVIRGSATDIYALRRRWAMDPLYDYKLNNILSEAWKINSTNNLLSEARTSSTNN